MRKIYDLNRRANELLERIDSLDRKEACSGR